MYETDLRPRRIVVEAYFADMARRDGLDFNPRADTVHLDLLERLLEETVGTRAFYIDVDWTRTPGIELLEKSVEFDTGTVDILNAFVGDPPDDLSTLWTIYRAWLHEGAAADEVAKLATR